MLNSFPEKRRKTEKTDFQKKIPTNGKRSRFRFAGKSILWINETYNRVFFAIKYKKNSTVFWKKLLFRAQVLQNRIKWCIIAPNWPSTFKTTVSQTEKRDEMQWRISALRIIRTLYVYVGIILRCFPTLHSENRISDSQYVECGCFVPFFSVFLCKTGIYQAIK